LELGGAEKERSKHRLLSSGNPLHEEEKENVDVQEMPGYEDFIFSSLVSLVFS